ncbi:YfjI family protein [Pseudomonas aeruginosa]|uniref:YfjI family protein n=1 Tax=Pseudomonas aeruginosa TaxID=287 RepID=UPI0021E93F87|nr:YfjI family protein [Pseudomonas aeruginosa]MCV3780621.1 YfjI family protein [Pseudomonas aeruginosa]MCV3823441.1 YfjI family protein [Pseudomonas aeruginosa]
MDSTSTANPTISALNEFPLLKEFVIEVAETTQAPLELVLASALTVLSLLCQPLIDVRRPGDMIGPISLLIILIANSGERKTTVESIFLAWIREYIKQAMIQHKKELLAWEFRLEAWEARKRMLIKDMTKNAPATIEYLSFENELILHQEQKPERPRAFKPIYEDATIAALIKGIRLDMPWVALMSSEGISVLKGALNDFGKINSLWSGSHIEVARATTEGLSANDARLTVGIMVQHDVLRDYLESKGDLARSVGLLSRALVFNPSSTQGTRFITEKTMNMEIMRKYNARVSQLLDQIMNRLHDETAPKIIINLSTDAESRWVSTYNKIEAGLQDGGEYERSKDHASKLSENVARVAAILHYFEGGDGTISLQELKSAEKIVLECSKTFREEFTFMPKIVNDAEILYNWLQLKCSDRKVFRWIEKNTILQKGPTRLRSVSKLNQALDCLVATGRVLINEKFKPVRIELL